MPVRRPKMAVQQHRTQSYGAPAPVRGIYATGAYSGGLALGTSTGVGGDNQTSTEIEAAIWLYNMVPSSFGCRIRSGSRELATNILDDSGLKGQIRTTMFFNSVVGGGLNDRVFVANANGIYDVTAGGPGPWTPVLEWPNKGGDAGWCSFINYTNVAGDHFLLVCDEDNGYYIYNGTGWAAGTFTGNPKPAASSLVHICEWNARIWFVEKNTARAWFLDPLALTGDIAPFDVGSRFKDGGHLVQNSTWTLDDGAGLDDRLVQVSSGGDVLVWSGIDPTVASDLTLLGRWTVGTVPEGRRVMSDWGGDVMILSVNGVVTLSGLLGGVSNIGEGRYLSRNINAYMRNAMQDTLDDYGWSLELVPKEGIGVLTVPVGTSPPIQFVIEINTQAWCMFRGLDMVCQTKIGAQFVFGTSDGRLMAYEGTQDNISLDNTISQAINFSMLTHYSTGAAPGQWKRGMFIRPYWIGAAKPVYEVKMQYDFNLDELLSQGGAPTSKLSLWDEAIWDTSVWEGTAQSYLDTQSIDGMGRHVAIALRGAAVNQLTYVGADVMFDVGGWL